MLRRRFTVYGMRPGVTPEDCVRGVDFWWLDGLDEVPELAERGSCNRACEVARVVRRSRRDSGRTARRYASPALRALAAALSR